MTMRTHAAFAVAATLAVVATMAWGFYIVGSPGARRLERFDEQRLSDLQAIAREIQVMVTDRGRVPKLREPLPQTLEEAVERSRNERLNLSDPETGAPYRYAVKNETTFELCAKFARPRDWDMRVFWNHPAGEHCFTINVLDPPPF